MKTVFNSLDLAVSVSELKSLIGMRVSQIYDIDHKTYIFKLNKPNHKSVLLLESGSRVHLTTFQWPKSNCPSSFTMKLRKHLSNKRLEAIDQLGNDRIVIMQFGTGEATYFLISEFFQRGNIILTDSTKTILNVLTPHKEGNNIRFAVHEKYPTDRGRKRIPPPDKNKLLELKNQSKKGTILKSLLPILDFGSSLIEHVLVSCGLGRNTKYNETIDDEKLEILASNLLKAEELFDNISKGPCKGYVIKQVVKSPDGKELETMIEFHPYLFDQNKNSLYSEFDSFNAAVDEFFSTMESQHIELKAFQMERDVMNKVEKIKLDQLNRIHDLTCKQEEDKIKADLILCNSEIVQDAIIIINSALASQKSWEAIESLVNEAKQQNDQVALIIDSLNFQTNHATLSLSDIYDEESEDKKKTLVEIDLALSAHANATMYYDHKKYAAQKERKTLESQDKALSSAQKKARVALKEIKTLTSIKKVQKPYWFEKFYWFISSENFLVIGGRDQAQNELIVKRYMTPGDLYVHADVHGASNVIIKNPTGEPVPIKTLNEAGTMAVCCSVGWESKLLCSAWWVMHNQVSKTAPTGEYLQTGSFMVRGHKNYLLPPQLSMGCGLMFRVSESSVERHIGERRIRAAEGVDAPIIEEPTKDALPSVSETEEIEKSEGTTNISESTDLDAADDKFDEVASQEQSEVASICSDDSNKNEVYENNSEPVMLDSGSNIQSDTNNQTSNSYSNKMKADLPLNKKRINDSGNAQNKILQTSVTLKRGQRSKLKKIKEKYKDQDEIDKNLCMSILKSAGEKKKSKKESKLSKNVNQKGSVKSVNQKIPESKKPQEPEDLDDPEIKLPTDLDALSVLTGLPYPDDELMYIVPVIAPYNTLSNYKFKLKLTPGTTKKGKAAKLALETFLYNEGCSLREKELIKTVDYQKFSTNFPGKVKISIPTVIKKKKPGSREPNKKLDS